MIYYDLTSSILSFSRPRPARDRTAKIAEAVTASARAPEVIVRCAIVISYFPRRALRKLAVLPILRVGACGGSPLGACSAVLRR